MMIQITHLLSLADAYQAATPVADTTLSFRVFKDSKKLAALRGGSDITTGRFNEAMTWFSENWPEQALWPIEVARSAPQEAEASAA